MGSIIRNLAKGTISKKTIFNRRFVIEVCEKFHIHYRNLRIILSKDDFITFLKGCIQAFSRWEARGCPENPTAHIELCRKDIKDPQENEIIVNLNRNLYNNYQDEIFSEGAEFTDEQYVHVKIRDLRLEMGIDEFRQFAQVIAEADRELANLPVNSML